MRVPAAFVQLSILNKLKISHTAWSIHYKNQEDFRTAFWDLAPNLNLN